MKELLQGTEGDCSKLQGTVELEEDPIQVARLKPSKRRIGYIECSIQNVIV